MTSQILALAAGYFLCSAAAEEHTLPKHRVAECTAIYTELKLAFTEVPSLSDFRSLVKEDRARVNRQGYLGFHSWMQQNPRLVASLREEARLRLYRFDF